MPRTKDREAATRVLSASRAHDPGMRTIGCPRCGSTQVVHLVIGQRREALAWIAVGVGTVAAIELLKPIVMRPRPELWPRLVEQGVFRPDLYYRLAGV